MAQSRTVGTLLYPVEASSARTPAVREPMPPVLPKPRLLDRVREALRVRHYSRRTEEAYVAWIRRYIFFHGKRHPAELGGARGHPLPERARRRGARGRLHPEPGAERAAVPVPRRAGRGPAVARRHRARQAAGAPARRPHAATRCAAVLRAARRHARGSWRPCCTGRGCGFLECCRLRVQDVDFASNQIVVRGGKGDKDRVDHAAGHGQGRPGPASGRRPRAAPA